jgi:hypothetical protein
LTIIITISSEGGGNITAGIEQVRISYAEMGSRASKHKIQNKDTNIKTEFMITNNKIMNRHTKNWDY